MSSTIAPTPKACWATLLTKPSYLQGALVLKHSLTKVGSAHPLVVYATKELLRDAREVLESHGIVVRSVEYLEPAKDLQTELDEHDKRFADTWTKLRCFELVEYDRVVMMDSDMLVVENMDELMTMELEDGWVAAAHACTCNPRKLTHYPDDWIPANCAHTQARRTNPLLPSSFTKPTHRLLNSGLVVLRPSHDTLNRIVKVLHTDPIVQTFKFPDQDLLAYVFNNRFMPLSYRYNALKTLKFCHPDMWLDEDVKNIHYILDKPWARRNQLGNEHAALHKMWWDAWDEVAALHSKSTPHWDLVTKYVARE